VRFIYFYLSFVFAGLRKLPSNTSRVLACDTNIDEVKVMADAGENEIPNEDDMKVDDENQKNAAATSAIQSTLLTDNKQQIIAGLAFMFYLNHFVCSHKQCRRIR
jgi:hypothetical protein